jgi:hypothetical protein
MEKTRMMMSSQNWNPSSRISRDGIGSVMYPSELEPIQKDILRTGKNIPRSGIGPGSGTKSPVGFLPGVKLVQ